MENIIKSQLEILLKDKYLTDAHRHSFYDIGKVKGMENLSVEEWIENSNYLKFDKKTKSLTGKALANYIKSWVEFSYDENIRTIVDFSAKHARNDLKSIYNSYNIKSFSPIKWTNISEITEDNIPNFIMLPDERDLTSDILKNIKMLLEKFPTIKLTMHCLESKFRKDLAMKKFGTSTIEFLNKHNILNNKLFLVHINEVTKIDIELIRKNHVKIILCPLIRDAFNYKTPPIPHQNLDIYFGTDVPLISKNRSLIDVAAKQINIWVKDGVKVEEALESAQKALVNSV